MAESKQPLSEEVEDMSWSEVAALARVYFRIPIALLLVEVFYWFITQPTNTLGVIQELEAWIWFQLTNLIYEFMELQYCPSTMVGQPWLL